MSEGVSNIYHMGKEEDTESGSAPTWEPIDPNDGALAQEVRGAFMEIDDAKKDRGVANARIAEAKANMEIKNIPREVMALIAKMRDWDQSKRDWFDHVYPIARKWIFEDPQGQLFEEKQS